MESVLVGLDWVLSLCSVPCLIDIKGKRDTAHVSISH